ncbi:hypothetical protein [Actinomadura roseirufa]|uniref:hypothetical protein n=1 Tax=Actinomadura roseirufa TaxID=2094049 RepID=UPI001041BA66|nr:hypothetical protein [Actinomadura roseirufa]
MDDEPARRLRESMRRHDWIAVQSFFAWATDPDDRAFYTDVCAAAPGVQHWIAEWCRAEPQSTLPLVIRSAHALLLGENLDVAERSLTNVVSRDPDDTTAWALLVDSASDRGAPPKEVRWRFEQVVRTHPWHLPAHQRMLAYLARHEGPEAMFDFVRAAVATSPEGGPLGMLVASAHIERWMALPRAKRRPYMTQASVRDDLLNAADRSIRHPGYRRRPGWPLIHNTFAFALVMAGEFHAAMEQFEIIDRRVTRRPWNAYSSDPVGAFTELRGWAGEWTGA